MVQPSSHRSLSPGSCRRIAPRYRCDVIQDLRRRAKKQGLRRDSDHGEAACGRVRGVAPAAADRRGHDPGRVGQGRGLNPRTVSDLERGISPTARKDPAELLATALGLAGDEERGQFLATARGRQAAAERPAGAEAAGGAWSPRSAGSPCSEAGPAAADGGYDDAAASNLGWLDSAVAEELRGPGARNSASWLRRGPRASAGHRVLTLVGGEPGIGKTALTAELARLARADKGLVLYGRWDEHVPPLTRRSARRWPTTRGPARRRCCAMTWPASPGKSPALCPRAGPANGAAPVEPLIAAEAERFRLFEALDTWDPADGGPAPRSPGARRPAVGRTCPPFSCSRT